MSNKDNAGGAYGPSTLAAGPCTCPEDWQGMDHTSGCKARAASAASRRGEPAPVRDPISGPDISDREFRELAETFRQCGEPAPASPTEGEWQKLAERIKAARHIKIGEGTRRFSDPYILSPEELAAVVAALLAASPDKPADRERK